MPNIIKSIIDYISSINIDGPKPRPHIGEAMGCWLYFTAIAEEIPALAAALNTTTDKELIGVINNSLDLAQ